ncbi:MAG: hypothetical protein ABSA85_13075 [Terracidiphilus sp.]|jgi:hypothetical protein
MHDLLIAFVFLTFVASPAIVAAMPLRERVKRPERHANGVDFPISSLTASR